jgi:hypothetical protein
MGGATHYGERKARPVVVFERTYCNNDSGICCDFTRDRDIHLKIAWISPEAGDLLQSSERRAGPSEQAQCSGESFHVALNNS